MKLRSPKHARDFGPNLLLRLAGVAAIIAFGIPMGVANAQDTVSLSGRITNGTAAATVPSSLEVTAVQISDENEEVEQKQTVAGTEATFRFDGFDPTLGNRFVVSTFHLDITYSRLFEAADPGEVNADLTIFELTEDASVISISSDVLTIETGEGGILEVIQLLRFENSSDRTFAGQLAGEGREVLQLPVPIGAFELFPLDGIGASSLTPSESGVVTAAPVLPGVASISYVYKIEAPRVWDLVREVFYPTMQADILVSTDLSFDGPLFTFEEELPIGERQYRRYLSNALVPGDIIEAQIRPASAPSGGGLSWGLAAGGVSILIVGFLTWQIRKSPPRQTGRGQIIDRIARLDEAFEAGSIEEEKYRRVRRQLKSRLGGTRRK